MAGFDSRLGLLLIVTWISLASSIGNGGLEVRILSTGALGLQPQHGPVRDEISGAVAESLAVDEHPSIIRKASGLGKADVVVSATAPLIGRSNLNAASLLMTKVHSKLRDRHGNVAAPENSGHESKPKAFRNKMFIHSSIVIFILVFFVVGCVLSVIISVFSSQSRAQFDAEADAEEDAHEAADGENENGPALTVEKVFHREPKGLDEDLYGMAIASLVRDTQRFALKTEMLWLRLGRLGVSLLVLIFTMSLQVFLLYEMKHLVTSVSTHEARDTYDKYEVWMYGNDTAAMVKTVNGFRRGVDANFNIANFATLDDDVKDSACEMPLSQPTFFIGILLVWTLVCVAELRKTADIGVCLVSATPTIGSMGDALTDTPEQGDEAVVLIGLTLPVKIVAVVFILIPRLVVTVLLLWLGCRWLTGTMGFSDVLQNAVTLEFILLLKDIFYKTMAPHHNQLETRNTLLLPHSDKERPSSSVFLGAFLWGIISIVWVLLYIEAFQEVLPDYRWDIHDACANYLAGVPTATTVPTAVGNAGNGSMPS